jgi:fused signal recognition particle receptor
VAFSLSKLTAGLKKTRTNWVARVKEAIGTKEKLNPSMLEDLEEALLGCDVGVEVSESLIERLKVDFAQIDGSEQALTSLKRALVESLGTGEDVKPASLPIVTMMVGVNGTGKTTTSGKLAHMYQQNGERVMLAACDTFRAAAIEQLKVWSDRVGCEIICGRPNGDPAAVAFDATEAAVARKVDRLIIDTAGRLHTKTNLMAELEKIGRVIDKARPGAPDEVLLVLDSTTGQNGLRQAEEFNRTVPLTGVVLTKMDGTAKGGIIFAIQHHLGLPVRFIGLGESAEDLDSFVPAEFVDALFAQPAGVLN